MDSARLLYDKPHVIVSIEIPDAAVREIRAKEDGVVSINYRKLFKQLTGRKRKDEGNKQKEKTLVASPAAGDQPLDLSMIGKKSSNLFCSVIDKLERKFLAFETRTPVDDVLDDDQGSMSESSNVSSVNASPEPVQVEAP
ncbi:hypothetical protein EON65_45655, partial [archaeon]